MRLFLLAWTVLAASCLPAQPERMFAPAIVSAPPPGSPMWKGPRGAVLADFTGDGNLDLVVGSANSTTGDLYLFAGDGLGVFAQPPAISSTGVATPELRPLHAADLNGDGIADLFVYRDAGPTYDIVPFIALPGGVFQALNPLPGSLGSGPRTVFADMNGNGFLDAVAVRLVSVNPWVQELQVLLNNGNATSWTPVGIENSSVDGYWPLALAAGDFNGDGLMDIAYYGVPVNPAGDVQVRFLLATGNMTYSAVSGGPANATHAAFVSGSGGFVYSLPWLRAVDATGDGIDDLVGVGQLGGMSGLPHTPGRVWIWPGRLGTAPGPVEWSDPPGLGGNTVHDQGPRVADLDLDGHPEVVISRASLGGNNPFDPPEVVRIAPRDAFGARARPDSDLAAGVVNVAPLHYTAPIFGTPVTTPAIASGPLAVGDVDNDGDLDIVEVWCMCLPAPPPVYYFSQPVVHAYLNQTVRRKACTVGASPLGLVRGTPSIGNAAYGIGLSGAPPGAGAALLASLGEDAITIGACTVGIDLTPGLRLLPTASLGFVTADGSGSAFVPVPIPWDPSLIGLTVFAQWIAADSSGPFTLGGVSYSLSDVAQITIW